MKVVSALAGLLLLSSPVLATDADRHLDDLSSALNDGVVNLSDPTLEGCADFTGKWVGQCSITINHNDEVLTATRDKSLIIEQQGCQLITMNGKKRTFNVAANKSLSSSEGFSHIQGAVYWMDGGQQLGFNKEQEGMLFDENAPYRKVKKSGVLSAGKDPGTAELKMKAMLKSDKRGEKEKTTYIYNCSLTLE